MFEWINKRGIFQSKVYFSVLWSFCVKFMKLWDNLTGEFEGLRGNLDSRRKFVIKVIISLHYINCRIVIQVRPSASFRPIRKSRTTFLVCLGCLCVCLGGIVGLWMHHWLRLLGNENHCMIKSIFNPLFYISKPSYNDQNSRTAAA